MKIKNTRRGFTLIELLVVVIIIAILAAIALPQYQKAVMKSRFASLKPIAKSVKDAQEMYYHRNGQYAGQSELADLDVGIPQEASIDISAEGDHQYIRANHTGLPHNSYTAYLDRSSNFAGNIYCEAYTGDTQAENLCLAEGGTVGPANGDYTLYLLSGNSTGSFVRPYELMGEDNLDRDYYKCGGCKTTYSDGNNRIEITNRGFAWEVTVYDQQESRISSISYYMPAYANYYPSSPTEEQMCTEYPFLSVCP